MGHKETGRLRSIPPAPEINQTTCRNLVNDKGDISYHSDKDGFYNTGCWYTEQTFRGKIRSIPCITYENKFQIDQRAKFEKLNYACTKIQHE